MSQMKAQKKLIMMDYTIFHFMNGIQNISRAA